MWSDGAVVIVKHGNREWANSIEKSITDIQNMTVCERMDLQAVQNEIYKKYYTRYWKKKINKARRKYGDNPHIPKALKAIEGVWALLMYNCKIFVDKYLVY